MTLRRSLVALLIAAGIAAADLRVPAAGQSAVAYDVVMARNVMVSARDGVKLGTDVYRPAKDGLPVDGAFPAILQRTPYNKARDSALADYFVPRGYVVVLQDVRGRYASEGHWRPIADWLPGFDASPRLFLLAPAGTPAAVIQRIDAETRKALADPSVVETLTKQGVVPAAGSSETLARDLRAEVQRWEGLIKQANITLQ